MYGKYKIVMLARIQVQRGLIWRFSQLCVLILCALLPGIGDATSVTKSNAVRAFAEQVSLKFYHVDAQQAAKHWPMPLAAYFSQRTMRELQDSWRASGLLHAIVTRHLQVTASLRADEPVVVRPEGDGRWQAKLPLVVSYDGAKWHSKQTLLLNLIIHEGAQGELVVTQLTTRKYRCVNEDIQWITAHETK